jgi:hypothetical protein
MDGDKPQTKPGPQKNRFREDAEESESERVESMPVDQPEVGNAENNQTAEGVHVYAEIEIGAQQSADHAEREGEKEARRESDGDDSGREGMNEFKLGFSHSRIIRAGGGKVLQ